MFDTEGNSFLRDTSEFFYLLDGLRKIRLKLLLLTEQSQAFLTKCTSR